MLVPKRPLQGLRKIVVTVFILCLEPITEPAVLHPRGFALVRACVPHPWSVCERCLVWAPLLLHVTQRGPHVRGARCGGRQWHRPSKPMVFHCTSERTRPTSETSQADFLKSKPFITAVADATGPKTCEADAALRSGSDFTLQPVGVCSLGSSPLSGGLRM